MSITFSVTMKDEDGVFGPVFPWETHDAEIFVPHNPADPDSDGDFVTNPHFVTDASVTWSNANAGAVVEALGLGEVDGGCFSLPVAEAETRIARFIAKVEMFPETVRTELETRFQTTLNHHAVQNMKERAIVLLHIVRKGMAAGGTHLSAA